MKLETVGILIELRPFGERDFIAKFFTADFGILAGMIKGGQVAKKNKPVTGQMGEISWNARLDSQLGVVKFNSIKNLSVLLMMDKKLLGYMNSIFSLIGLLLPERENFNGLYDKTIKALVDLADVNMCPKSVYIGWELGFMSDMGYGLDLTECSGCGSKNDLTNLSPKTGRAVCSKCATPYLDRLYNLPVNISDLRKFMMKICENQGVNLPYPRQSLGL